MLRHSLLDDALFHVSLPTEGEAACLSLPQVLARLSLGHDLVFISLRPHQAPAWHAFLVQLGYLALEADESFSVPETDTAWAAKLRQLTQDFRDDSPWFLINSDWQLPAFMQAPVPFGRESDFKRRDSSSQAIDVLVTSRNHDEKTAKLKLSDRSLDCLIYALISLQGWTKQDGQGRYFSMRINGGYASRPQFRLSFERGSGHEFLRDLRALDEGSSRDLEVASKVGFGTADHKPYSLLWTVPWGDAQLSIQDIHPYCLEVCRRVRLVVVGGNLLLHGATSNANRVAAEDFKGCVFDPWTPVELTEPPKALNAQPNTLHYARLQEILFDGTKTRLPLLARPTESERRMNLPATLIARALVGGNGRTNGYVQKELPIPPNVLTRVATSEAEISIRSSAFVRLAAHAESDIYRGALQRFVGGRGREKYKYAEYAQTIEPFIEHYKQQIDEAFFTVLFATIETEPDALGAQRQWADWLERTVRDDLEAAIAVLPTRERSRLFAQDRSRHFLNCGLAAHFGPLRAAIDPIGSSQQGRTHA